MTGSGTAAVKSSSQLTSVLCSPADMSAKNSVHDPFGSLPVYVEAKLARLALSNVLGDEFGSMFRPSGCHAE